MAICGVEDRSNESGNACVVEEISQMRNDIQGADANVQDNIAAGDISSENCIKSLINKGEPEYVEEELPSPSDFISEPTVTTKTYDGHHEIDTTDTKTSQIGFFGRYIDFSKDDCHCILLFSQRSMERYIIQKCMGI